MFGKIHDIVNNLMNLPCLLGQIKNMCVSGNRSGIFR